MLMQLSGALEVKEHAVSKRFQDMGKILKYLRKSSLAQIVTGDENWIYFDYPKRKKSWVSPGQLSTSQSRGEIFMVQKLCFASGRIRNM